MDRKRWAEPGDLKPCGFRSRRRPHAPLLVRDHRHDADREPVCVRHVSGHEIDAGLLQAEEERGASAEPIEFHDDELCATDTTSLERLGPLWTIRLLAALDPGERGRE